MSVNNYKEQGTMEKNIITAGLYKDAKIESDDDGAFIIAETDNEKKKIYLNSCVIKKIKVANNARGDMLYICNVKWLSGDKSVMNTTEKTFELINAGIHCGGPEPQIYIDPEKKTDISTEAVMVVIVVIIVLAILAEMF